MMRAQPIRTSSRIGALQPVSCATATRPQASSPEWPGRQPSEVETTQSRDVFFALRRPARGIRVEAAPRTQSVRLGPQPPTRGVRRRPILLEYGVGRQKSPWSRLRSGRSTLHGPAACGGEREHDDFSSRRSALPNALTLKVSRGRSQKSRASHRILFPLNHRLSQASVSAFPSVVVFPHLHHPAAVLRSSR
jgi:hypothetical protein